MVEVSAFFDKKFLCPLCQMTFTSLAVRSSKVYIGERESDFHVIYNGVNPTHYSIIVCPACTYAASNNLFANPLPMNMIKGLSAALLQMPLEKPVDFSKERALHTVLLSFKLAIRTAQLKKVPPGELAGLLLAAGWINREIGDSESEKNYLAEALKFYLEAYQKSSKNVGNLSEVQAAYIIGELYLRQNNFTEAINWFNNTIFHPNIKKYPAIEKMARDQWALAREKSKSWPDSFTADNDNKPANNVQTATIPPSPAVEKAAAKPVPAPQRRNSMQMLVHLYPDQIEWLNKIVNCGYESSKKIVGKEQVLRTIIDTLMEELDGKLPTDFSSEKELQLRLKSLLDSKD
ncbi:MAG: DUF2225 domain-containing protein [Syntrophomonas sp.]|nr:DUF2225 domain-containing protein [Syntrophomonas sp.]